MTNFELVVTLVAGVWAERMAFRLAKYDLAPFIIRLQGNVQPSDPAAEYMKWLRKYGL